MGGVISKAGGGSSSGGKGGKKSSGSRAGKAEIEGAQLGIDEIARQFNLTREDLLGIREQFDPFIQAGTSALGNLESGATQQGLEANLANIFSGEGFQQLRDERTNALQGQLAAGGLTRSGTGLQEIANVPTDLGFQIENLLSGRQQNLASGGLSALGGQAGLGVAQGGFGQGASGGIAQLLKGQGVSEGAGIITDAAAQQETTNQIINLASKFLLASDPRLKENVVEIAQIHDLKLCQWDWIPELNGSTIHGLKIEDMPTIGFMADEVEEKYPRHVYEFGGYRTIDYSSLLVELEAVNDYLAEAA